VKKPQQLVSLGTIKLRFQDDWDHMFQLASTLQQAVYECDYSQYLQTDSHETDSGMQEEKTQNA
jgi:hypothetical protein